MNNPYYFPTLYKKTNTGAMQYWSIAVRGRDISTKYGQVGTQNEQETVDTIKEGKNLGKKNETTPEEQAFLEAKARWTKKIQRHRYVEDQERALRGENDAAGGCAPMLAATHKVCPNTLIYPCIVQRKFNGVRIIAEYDDGVCTLWSRKQEKMIGFPHIAKAVEELFGGKPGYHLLDGEGYVHGWTLQKIASFARQKKTPKPGYEKISYYIYDYPSHEGTNHQRQAALDNLPLTGPLLPVEATRGTSEEQIWSLHNEFVADGYEGAIGRNLLAKYQFGKRSRDLHKFKTFEDHEFKIIGYRLDGKGKFAGIPIFCCKTDDGKEFECNLKGTLEDRRAMDPKAVVGELMTVRHIGWTEDGKPWHPVGVCIRDYE